MTKPKQSLPIFQVGPKKITFSDPRGIFWLGVTVDDNMPMQVPDLDDIDEQYVRAQDRASQKMAERARDSMRGFFTKGSPTFVGIHWRGLSAKGISVMKQPSGDPGAVMYQIRERRASLRVIRQGLRPPNSRRPHQRKDVFMQWIKDKKLRYQGGKKRLSAEQKLEATYWRVRQHIISEGVGDWWQGHASHIENGAFNYPQHYRENYARQEMETIMRDFFLKGDAKTGIRAFIDSVVWGALSAADFQATGRQRVNKGTYGHGNERTIDGISRRGRKQGLWRNYTVAFGMDEDAAADVTEAWSDHTYRERAIKKISSPVPIKKRRKK